MDITKQLNSIFYNIHFKKEEERLRRSLNHVVYTDTYRTEHKNNPKSSLAYSGKLESIFHVRHYYDFTFFL